MAWAVLFVALFAATAPVIAATTRMLIFQDITQHAASALPSWFADFAAYHLLGMRDANGDGGIGAAELVIARDGIMIALPMAAKLPFIFTVLIATAGLGAAIAAAASHLFTLAGSLAEDVVGVIDPRHAALPRLMVAWVAIAATAISAAVFLAIADLDVLQTATTALAFSAATFFPVLVLSIWWKRCTWLGASLALGLGFATMCADLLLGGTIGNNSHLTTIIAALFGATLGIAGGIAGSLFGPQPSPQEQTYFEELREPGGEALYERAQRRIAAATDQTSPA
jgi:cation/acetate symporter